MPAESSEQWLAIDLALGGVLPHSLPLLPKSFRSDLKGSLF